jgi:hypothetical protein
MVSMRTKFYRLTGLISSLIPTVAVMVMTSGSAPAQTPPASPVLGKRTSFDVPLAKLSISIDEVTHELNSVRISFEGSNDYAVITPFDDEKIHITAQGREKEIFREQPEVAYLTTDFEREQLLKVTQSFMETLNILENDLRHERWDRCLYLDGYLPRFLHGYYYLCDAVRNSQDALPRNAHISEAAFDVSLNSSKSDERINHWKADPAYVLKLRIVTKELVYQLKQWETQSRKSSTNPELFLNTKVKEAYGLFVHLYFNIKPPPPLNFHRGRHLSEFLSSPGIDLQNTLAEVIEEE